MPAQPPLSNRLAPLRWIDAFVPSLGGRPDLVLRQRVLVTCSFTLAALAFLFGVQAARLEGGTSTITTVLWAGSLLAVCYPLLQRRTGSVAVPGTLLCTEFALLIGLVALHGNGFEGPVLIWAPATPLLAAFLVGPLAALAVALLAAAEIVVLFWLDQSHLLPADTFAPEQIEHVRLLVLVSGVFFAAFLGWLYESQTVRELRRVNRELHAAKERAEASERLKSALLMNMSHEVRTPLTSIVGLAELLREEKEGVDRELAGSIHASGLRLFGMLDKVIDFAQAESGTLIPSPRAAPILPCLRAAVDAVRPRAKAKGLDLYIDVADETPAVHTDPAFVRRILDLLLDNAVRFTDAGHVHVRVGTESETVTIAIEDTGPGISASFLPHVFEAFLQESDGIGRAHEGIGLGLALAHRMAALLGGTLTVDSELGHGSTFTLALPHAASAARSDTRSGPRDYRRPPRSADHPNSAAWSATSRSATAPWR